MDAKALCALALCVSLAGCSLLERQYVTVEPHSGKFWESEAAGTLRAENYQDIVNDLLLLISQRRESATLRLYHFGDDAAISDRLEQATMEIQRQTPLGSYAVSYIASVSQAQRGYHEVKLQIGYRRTKEELQAIVNATSPEALYTLLRNALDRGQNELAVRIGYWGPDAEEQLEEAKARLREDEGLADFPDWPETLSYPEEGPTGLLEFRLDFPPESGTETNEASPESEAATNGESPETETAANGETPETETAVADNETPETKTGEANAL